MNHSTTAVAQSTTSATNPALTITDWNSIKIPLSYFSQTCLPILFGVIFGGLAWLVVGLRTYTRAVILQKYSWDDLAMTLALVRSYLFVVA
jgi:glycerol uptake facilitator-like aquaporin